MKVNREASPLRYPGGKSPIAPFIESAMRSNGCIGGTYLEPFAGGASVGLQLLFNERVEQIVINDFDFRIYAFWASILRYPQRFAEKVLSIELSIEEWRRQRDIYLKPKSNSRFNVGFAAFYLNRCNRSGILVNGGPIGGYDQKGNYKIDARFNRSSLADRILRVGNYSERIEVFNVDALSLLASRKFKYYSRPFIYLDPPYFVQGNSLYYNSFTESDHALLARELLRLRTIPWVLTYDDVPQIRALYKSIAASPFSLRYSANTSREGRELLISPSHVKLP